MLTTRSNAQSNPRIITAFWLSAAVCAGFILGLLFVPARVLADESGRPPWILLPSGQSTAASDIRQQAILEAEVDVRSQADAALLRKMGHLCPIGVCKLELRAEEELVLTRLGFSVRPVARAIRVSGSARSPGSTATSLGEKSAYGEDWTDHDIPDRGADGPCGIAARSDIAISAAPEAATVSRVKYTIRIEHEHVGDLLVQLGTTQFGYSSIWDHLGAGGDGGYDDDPELDADIELISRETFTFYGEPVNQSWSLLAYDCTAGSTGFVDYWYIYVYYWSCDVPTTPVNLYPQNDAVQQPRNVELIWDLASGATSYDIYFGTTSPPSRHGNTTATSYLLQGLNCSTRYYWTVVAKSDCASTSGPEWSFSTACCAPDAPSGPSPADHSTGMPLNVDLDWADASGATMYDVYFGASASPPLLGNTTASFYALPALTCGTHYYWRIVSRSPCGDAGGEVWQFDTACCTPGEPSDPSPADGSSDQPIDGDLDWADSPLATSYDVYLGTTTPLPLLGNTTSSSFPLPELKCATRYRWRIVAKSECASNSGDEWEFTTTCCAPATPSGPSPADKAIGVALDANLDWANAAYATQYDVYFGISASPPFLGSTTSSSYPLLTLSYNTHYYWKIVARNSCRDIAGPVWDFVTCAPLGVPGSPEPANGATGVATTVDLDWADAPGATSYDVYFGASGTPAFIGNTPSSNYALPGLGSLTRYQWYVVAKNDCGGTAGPVWEFTTGEQVLQRIHLPIVFRP